MTTTRAASQLVRLPLCTSSCRLAPRRVSGLRCPRARRRAWGIAPNAATVAVPGASAPQNHQQLRGVRVSRSRCHFEEPGIETDQASGSCSARRRRVGDAVEGRRPERHTRSTSGFRAWSTLRRRLPGALGQSWSGADYEAIRSRPGVIAVVREFRTRPSKRDTSDAGWRAGRRAKPGNQAKSRSPADRMGLRRQADAPARRDLAARIGECAATGKLSVEPAGEVASLTAPEASAPARHLRRARRRPQFVAADYHRPFGAHMPDGTGRRDGASPTPASGSHGHRREPGDAAAAGRRRGSGRDPRQGFARTVFLGGGFGGSSPSNMW